MEEFLEESRNWKEYLKESWRNPGSTEGILQGSSGGVSEVTCVSIKKKNALGSSQGITFEY